MASELTSYDVIIVGGGLVGLCIAAHLVGAQRNVGVIVGAHEGRASLAAAGMLTPTCEWSPESPRSFLDFLRVGREYYQDFLTSTLEISDVKSEIGYEEKGFLLLDLLENDQDLTSRFESLRATGAHVAWLTRQEVYQLEPSVNPEAIRGAIRVSDDGVVNPRALHKLLLERLASRAHLLNTNLLSVAECGSDFKLTLEDNTTLICPQVIIAAGAWSYEVAEQFHLDVPVFPAKGQIIQLAGEPDILRHILYMPAGACGCVLERSPGTYIVGTSEEYLSAEVANTSKVIAAILRRANEVFLPAGDFVVEDMWSGFRPITPDELPIISRSDDPRIIIATGHFRNGVLLSPLTGLLVKALLEGNDPPVDLQPYRFPRVFPPSYRFASAY